MSTPLQVALAIVGAVADSKASQSPLHVAAIAAQIARHHPTVGYRCRDIADALTDEGLAAGVTIAPGPLN